VIVSASALHYFDRPEVALAEMRRVLKPGRSVVILDWCRDYLLCLLFDIVLKLIDPAYHRRYYPTRISSLTGFGTSSPQGKCGLAWFGD
jgi:ubiquinone/menaquinone biosynthesis C-methylase UbiE